MALMYVLSERLIHVSIYVLLKVVVKSLVLLLPEQFVQHCSWLECLLKTKCRCVFSIHEILSQPSLAHFCLKKLYLMPPLEAPNGAALIVQCNHCKVSR